MSVIIVSDEHVRALVDFAKNPRNDVYSSKPFPMAAGGVIEFREMTDAELFLAIRHENYRSYNVRYPSAQAIPQTGYRPGVAREYTPVEIIKAAQSFKYQACETEDWEETPTAKLIKGIIGAAIAKLPGYDAAEWIIPEAAPRIVSLSSLVRGRK